MIQLKLILLTTAFLLLKNTGNSQTNKDSLNNSQKEQYLDGTYYTEKMPSDIGESHRIYFKFKKDGTVLSLTSPLECDSVNKTIEKKYAETAIYTITKTNSIEFKFVNNRVNNNEYTSTCSAIIINNEKLKITIITQYKESKPYNRYFDITLCH